VGSEVWQINTGKGAANDEHGTFTKVIADDNTIRFDVYRNLGQSRFKLRCSWTVTATPPSDAPTDLSARAVSSDQVELQWSDNSTGETGFRIERKTAGHGYAWIGSADADSDGYSDSGLSASVTYTYRICAFDESGDSFFSDEAVVTTRVSSSSVGGGEGGGGCFISSAAQCRPASERRP
jgi:hypothetical protein